MQTNASTLTDLPWTPQMAAALERASSAIGGLDARICASPVAGPWTRRAAWSGYARALQLQGFEIDEVDVFSWGCALPLPGRPRLASHDDPFVQFPTWRDEFPGNRRRHWREGLGTLASPLPGYLGPQLLRLLEAMREMTVKDPSIYAWLALPLILQRAGVTRSLLPCLVVGDRRLRQRTAPDDGLVVRLLGGLFKAAQTGLERAEALERDRARAARVIASTRRPGALLTLLARVQLTPVCAPQAIASELGLTLAGAGRLLARAASHGLLREVSGRHSWRLYLPPDLAVVFGFTPRPRGRPRAEPPPLPPQSAPRDLSEVLAEFDRELADVISRLPGLADVQDDDGRQ